MKGLVIVPTYNERENIVALIRQVLALEYDLEVLVVDDNSPDGTGDLAEALAHDDGRIAVLHRGEKRGLGSAYVAGFQWGITHGPYDLLLEMDADFSHDPSYVPALLEKSRDHDLVVGSRYLHGANVVNWPLGRLLLSYYANWYARLVTGMPVRDTTSGFKCFRRQAIESLDLGRVHSEGYAFQIEMTYRIWKQGFRICEVPIVFYDRQRGTSKMSFAIAKEAAWLVWKLRALSLFGRL